MNVTTKDDISLIALSKSKGLKVTCDVSVYSLFLSQNEYPDCPALPTIEDQKALWDHLETIDVFSTGGLPYQLAGKEAVPTLGLNEAVPLLLTAVSEGRMTLDDLINRMHHNPKAIFELHEQSKQLRRSRHRSAVCTTSGTGLVTVRGPNTARCSFESHFSRPKWLALMEKWRSIRLQVMTCRLMFFKLHPRSKQCLLSCGQRVPSIESSHPSIQQSLGRISMSTAAPTLDPSPSCRRAV